MPMRLRSAAILSEAVTACGAALADASVTALAVRKSLSAVASTARLLFSCLLACASVAATSGAASGLGGGGAAGAPVGVADLLCSLASLALARIAGREDESLVILLSSHQQEPAPFDGSWLPA